MSVCFCVPDAPRREALVACTRFVGASEACSSALRCGECDNGVDYVAISGVAELTLSDETAAVILALSDIAPSHGDALGGAISPTDLGAVRLVIEHVIAVDMLGHAHGGVDESYREPLWRLDCLLAAAQANGLWVAWSSGLLLAWF